MHNFMILSLFVATVATLAGCASHLPPFQKAVGDEPGYTVTKNIDAHAFVVKTDMKGRADAKYSIFYGYRAVGEECLTRKFEYFDIAVVDPETFEGYCYPTHDHPALAVEFAERGLDARPQRFIVGDLLGKTKTSLEKGDEIIAIDGVPPLSVATFRSIVYRASSTGHTSVGLKIKRHDKDQEIKEPIALLKNSSMGSTQLDLFRSRVK